MASHVINLYNFSADELWEDNTVPFPEMSKQLKYNLFPSRYRRKSILGRSIKALPLGLNSALLPPSPPQVNANWWEGLLSLFTIADRECDEEIKSIWTAGTNPFQINFLIPLVSTSDSCFLQIKQKHTVHTILRRNKQTKILYRQ